MRFVGIERKHDWRQIELMEIWEMKKVFDYFLGEFE
jgi:hypothetical protein